MPVPPWAQCWGCLPRDRDPRPFPSPSNRGPGEGPTRQARKPATPTSGGNGLFCLHPHLPGLGGSLSTTTAIQTRRAWPAKGRGFCPLGVRAFLHRSLLVLPCSKLYWPTRQLVLKPRRVTNAEGNAAHGAAGLTWGVGGPGSRQSQRPAQAADDRTGLRRQCPRLAGSHRLRHHLVTHVQPILCTEVLWPESGPSPQGTGL